MIDTTICPECGDLAEVQDRSVLESTSGPVEHVKVMCVRRHWFLLPAEMLTSPRLDRERSRGASLPRGAAASRGASMPSAQDPPRRESGPRRS